MAAQKFQVAPVALWCSPSPASHYEADWHQVFAQKLWQLGDIRRDPPRLVPLQ